MVTLTKSFGDLTTTKFYQSPVFFFIFRNILKSRQITLFQIWTEKTTTFISMHHYNETVIGIPLGVISIQTSRMNLSITQCPSLYIGWIRHNPHTVKYSRKMNHRSSKKENRGKLNEQMWVLNIIKSSTRSENLFTALPRKFMALLIKNSFLTI